MISNLCKLLYNPLKRKILLRIYTSRDGVNVGVLADEMLYKGLVPSGVSQYLKELKNINIIRRSRDGRYANYYPNTKYTPLEFRRVIQELIKLDGKLDQPAIDTIFGALMNPFRARVVASLAKAGSIPALEICEMTKHQPRYLKRDLKAAVDAGLIWADDSETSLAVYHYTPPANPLAKLLVSLC